VHNCGSGMCITLLRKTSLTLQSTDSLERERLSLSLLRERMTSKETKFHLNKSRIFLRISRVWPWTLALQPSGTYSVEVQPVLMIDTSQLCKA
jgi:hypothetical protein